MAEKMADIDAVASRAAIQGLGSLLAELRKADVLDMAAANNVGRSVLHAIDTLGHGVDGHEQLRGWASLQLNLHQK